MGENLQISIIYVLKIIIIGLWSQDVHTTQWHATTQPNFITKVKPTQWEKMPSRQKPKPTKKPIVPTIGHVKRPTLPSTSTTTSTVTKVSSLLPQSTKPKPDEVLKEQFIIKN